MPAPSEGSPQESELELADKGKGGKGKAKLKGKGNGKGNGQMMKGKGKGKMQKGAGPVAVREKVVYQRKSRNAGQHTIEIYHPQFFFTQISMEEYDARPDRYGPSVIGKYTKGIGQVEARFPTDDEDPISFAMTSVHRLISRMEERGINETGNYQPDGVPLNLWNAIGRLDVGTESITDRSKSMKSYVMDLFERYGNESNIEGVDQYNACYGGQACGLCTLSWIESDRWDGRYGIATATDISEAHPAFMAFVGASSTSALFFVDAPLPHHSQRASCILHRFDFFKPVGWHDMAPITDGKYSVECYLDALDACYSTLRKKLNDRDILKITDYNVFHTGGGYHIVRKAFERLVRNELPDCKGAARDELVEVKLHPSVSLLKIIGPCHTVSSFLNTSAVIMNTMEQGLGKVICVFTYGSGCAASMYQMRIDEVAYFDPLELWKLKFYKNAMRMHPEHSGPLHMFYVETWMKFDFIPTGRKIFQIPVWKYESDCYYLMEIDKFGRRFYHRGGMAAGPYPEELQTKVLDRAEDRRTRKTWGPVPEKELQVEKSQEENWAKIEYDMTYDHEAEDGNCEQVEVMDRYNKEQRVTIIKKFPDRKQHGATIYPDGLEHSYQIVGTWNGRKSQDMSWMPDGGWYFELTLGENRWEEFYLEQDYDPTRRIYPHVEKASKDVTCVGPHHGGKGKLWFLDCRDRVNVPEDQVGMPGDKYLIKFRWDRLKSLSWEKKTGTTGDHAPSRYFAVGSWCDWDFIELMQDDSRPAGWYSTEVQMTSLGIEFKIVRNEDLTQQIYPLVTHQRDLPVTEDTPIAGPDEFQQFHWKIEDELGAVFRIDFYRDPEDCEPTGMKVQWTKLATRPVVEPEPTYYIIGVCNDWGANGHIKMQHPPGSLSVFTGVVNVWEMEYDPAQPGRKKPMMPFKIVMHKDPRRCIHPDKDECSQLMAHKVVLDDLGASFAWHIGKVPADKARGDDTFIVKLEIYDDGGMKVSWQKRG